jgi:hypothetical protein
MTEEDLGRVIDIIRKIEKSKEKRGNRREAQGERRRKA